MHCSSVTHNWITVTWFIKELEQAKVSPKLPTSILIFMIKRFLLIAPLNWSVCVH